MVDFLILKLQGPMQAWGGHSFEGTRPSGNFPTRSALLGLLGACLGIRRNEYVRQQQLADSVLFAVRKDGRQVNTVWGEVKALPVIKMTDYHTVKDARENYAGLKSHETIQTWREYLLDAEYTVAIWVNEGTVVSIADIEAAIRKPVFTPYLGRRSCPLAQPLLRQRLAAQNAVEALRVVEPGGGVIYSDQKLDGSAGRNMRLRDVPMEGNRVNSHLARFIFMEGSMYLSKVMIHGSICRNPYEIHRALWGLFPENADAERDYLFRVVRSGQQQAEVLMQSFREPIAGSASGISLLACKDYPLSLSVGQQLRFQLIANPVKTINDENGRLNSRGEVKKCRVPLIHEEEWRTWLERKVADCAELQTLIAEKRLPLNFRKTKEKRVGKIQPVDFQGVLQVKDSTILSELIGAGIGPAKAFGCGMLSLARA